MAIRIELMDEELGKINTSKVTAVQKKDDLQKDLGNLYIKSSMGSLSVFPSNAKFETKDREEQIILILRRHFATNIFWILGSTLAITVPVLAFLVGFSPASLEVRYQILLLLLWTLMVSGYALENFLSWFFNVYIVTNERVVDIDFHNFLYREISDADLDKIQDITIKGSGLGAAIFHYGDILIQTAAEKEEFEFLAVPQPEIVSRVIRELIEYNELVERKEK